MIIIDLILTAIVVMDKLKGYYFACKHQRSQILTNAINQLFSKNVKEKQQQNVL